jgi:hypothetical protein
MAGDPINWKAMTLKEKHNIVQKVEANLNNGEIFRWAIMICFINFSLAQK